MDTNNLNGMDNNPSNNGAAGNDTYAYNQQAEHSQSQYAHGQQGGYHMEEPKKSSGLAIASMVCGIASIVLCCLWYVSIVLAIVAIVLGIINNVKKLGGRGMAIAGIVTGAVGLLLVVALFILAAIGIASSDLYNNF